MCSSTHWTENVILYTYRPADVLWLDICSLDEVLVCRAELYSDMNVGEAVARFITSFGCSMRLVLAARSYGFSTIVRKMTVNDAEQLLELHYANISKGIRDKVVMIRVSHGRFIDEKANSTGMQTRRSINH